MRLVLRPKIGLFARIRLDEIVFAEKILDISFFQFVYFILLLYPQITISVSVFFIENSNTIVLYELFLSLFIFDFKRLLMGHIKLVKRKSRRMDLSRKVLMSEI